MSNRARQSTANCELPCALELQACLKRIRSWRTPPNWCIADWFQEIAAIAAGAAWEAQHQFDPSRGISIGAFVHSRVLARTLTRYRQEWAFGIRCVGELAESQDRQTDVNGRHSFFPVDQRHPEFGALSDAVTELSGTSRWLIEQLFWAGRTEVEIGRELGITQQAIAKRKRSVLSALRQRLNPASKKFF